MAEGIELISTMITRYAVVESLYLLEDFSLKAQLTEGITKLYVAILKYLGIARTYYGKGTLSKHHFIWYLVVTRTDPRFRANWRKCHQIIAYIS
jgi:hypothetical protein